MKRIGNLVLICSALLLTNAKAESVSAEQLERAVFLSMMLSQDFEESRLGVRILADRFPNDDSVCDYVAERLLKESNSPRGAAVDAISWYVVTLRDSCSARYRNALTLARQRYTEGEIVRQLDTALAKPADGSVEQYAEDGVDLLAREAELQRQLSAHVGTSGAARRMRSGTSFGDVMQFAGTPQAMSALIASTLAAHYRGSGILIFHRDRVTGKWLLGETFPELFPLSDTLTGSRFEIAQYVACLRAKPFRLQIKIHGREIREDHDLTWVLANRLSRSPLPSDRYEEDGLLVGLELVATSRHPDTIDMLRQIGAAPGDKVPEDARAYARKLESRTGTPPASK